jgi:predicted outer membrane protein
MEQTCSVSSDEGGAVRTRPIRQVVANAVAVLAVIGIVFGAVTACGSPDQPREPTPIAPDQPGTPGGLNAALGMGANNTLGAAGSAASAIAALGGLGQAQGSAQDVRTLSAQYSTDGQAVLDQFKASVGGILATEPTAEQQATLADLRARSGEQFDQAWLRAAGRFQQQVREAANAVLADENASDQAKAAAQDALKRLDSTAEELQQASAPAGAATPGAVDAGSGGQAAGDVTPAAIVLVGVGALLLSGALWWRRRAA